MLVCFGLFGLLLYNTVVANAVCSFTYSQKDEIKALSQLYEQKGYPQCEYRITAPHNSYIELNLTSVFGFWPTALPSMSPGAARDPNLCLPPELLIQELAQGQQRTTVVGKFCTNHNSLQLQRPYVFQSNLNTVQITYIWLEHHPSGFTLDFDFHHQNNNCVHYCDDQTCLSDNQLLCNGVYDCSDKSDEKDCPEQQSTGAASRSTASDVDFVKILVIIISVVLMPGLSIIICVVSPCRLRSRMWRRRRRNRDGLVHSQLRPHSQGSEVVDVPTSTTSQDHLLEPHQVSLMRDRQVQMQSVQTDIILDLPPQIPISKDGEEGYLTSQKQLIFKSCGKDTDQCCFRPPPNRTVYDRESPPPYYSNTPNVETLNRPPTRIVRDNEGCPVVSRCYSMSASSSVGASHQKPSQAMAKAKTHNRTMSTNSGVLPAVASTSSLPNSLQHEDNGDKPPDYSHVFCSDTNSRPVHLPLNNV